MQYNGDGDGVRLVVERYNNPGPIGIPNFRSPESDINV